MVLLNLKEILEHAEGFAQAMGACPRASVATYLFDDSGMRRARAANTRFDGKCNCNDGADTLTQASATCMAQHSEVRALLAAAREGWYPFLETAVVTRPPCCKCLPSLLESPVRTIVTSDRWPDRDNMAPVWRSFGREWVVIGMEKPLG